MKKILIAFVVVGLFSSCLRNKEENQEEKKEDTAVSNFSVGDKKVMVYTTADSGSYRLSLIDSNLKFKDLAQPMETQVCVFVDPDKTFQTFFGIGAALTDASAETYFKLPADQRQELLKAYFDKEKRNRLYCCTYEY